MWTSPRPWTSTVRSLSILSSSIAATTLQGTEKLILHCVLLSSPLPLHLYGMTSGFFSFLWVCICVREHITISSPGEPWPAKPPHKILSNAAIFVQPGPACAPSLYTKHGWRQGVSSMISEDNPGSTESSLLFSARFQLFFFLFFFFSVRQMCCCKIFLVTGNVKKKKKKYFAVTVTSGRFQGRCGTRPPRRRERETVVISVNAKR